MCQSHWSMKYRSRSPDQDTGKVLTLRRSTMQGLVVVGLIVEEISNVDIKGVSHCSVIYRSRSPGQRICWVSTLRSTMQGLVVVGLLVEEIWNVDLKCVKVTGAGIQVKVIGSRYLQSPYIEEKHYTRFGGCRPYSWGDFKSPCKMCQSHWSAKNRSRSPGQGTCQVATSRIYT